MIYISDSPDTLSAAHNPIEFTMTSNSIGRVTMTVTSVTNDSGNVRLVDSVTDLVTIQAGDTMYLSGFGETTYNGYFTVLSNNGGSITVDLAYVGNSTGTAVRRNDNFQFKVDVYVKDSVYSNCAAVSKFAADFGGTILQDGDFVFQQGFTGGGAVYNGLFEIEDVVNTTGTVYQYTLVGIAAPGIVTGGKCIKMRKVGSIYQQPDDITLTKQATIDISTMLGASVTEQQFTLATSNIQTTATDESMTRYAIVVTEVFDDIDGVQQENDTSLDDGKYYPEYRNYSFYALNAVNQTNETQTLARYDMDGVTKKFLSDIPNSATIHIDQELQLAFLTQVSGAQIWYQGYNLAGVAQTAATITGVTLQSANETYRRAIIPINKNTILSSAYSKVDFKILSTGTGTPAISETKTLFIDNKCYKYPVILEFKNRRGGFDTYYFISSEKSHNSEKQFFKSVGIKGTYSNISTRRYKLSGRYETVAVMSWLEQLWESKEVYMIDSTYSSGRVKVNIISSDHIIYQDDLISPVCEIELQEPKQN